MTFDPWQDSFYYPEHKEIFRGEKTDRDRDSDAGVAQTYANLERQIRWFARTFGQEEAQKVIDRAME